MIPCLRIVCTILPNLLRMLGPNTEPGPVMSVLAEPGTSPNRRHAAWRSDTQRAVRDYYVPAWQQPVNPLSLPATTRIETSRSL